MEKLIQILTSNRFKSFYWRTAMMAIAGFLGLLAQNVGKLELPPEATAVLGLVLGEISKTLTDNYKLKKKK